MAEIQHHSPEGDDDPAPRTVSGDCPQLSGEAVIGRSGSLLKRMADKRLMDPAPARVEALQRRVVEAIKGGELTLARQLLTRALALYGPADPNRAAVQKIADVVDGGIASGLDGVAQGSPEWLAR